MGITSLRLPNGCIFRVYGIRWHTMGIFPSVSRMDALPRQHKLCRAGVYRNWSDLFVDHDDPPLSISMVAITPSWIYFGHQRMGNKLHLVLILVELVDQVDYPETWSL